FSSRRRHTRSKRDWSSDVCSSDLRIEQIGTPEEFKKHPKNKFVEEFIGNLIEQRVTAGDFVSDKHVTDNIDGYPEIESNMDIKRSEERRVGKECRYRE